MSNEMVDCETDDEMMMVDCETDDEMVDCETDDETDIFSNIVESETDYKMLGDEKYKIILQSHLSKPNKDKV